MSPTVKALAVKLKQDFKTADERIDKYLHQRIKEIIDGHEAQTRHRDWAQYGNFWPPTVINALRENRLIFFMGAGISAAAGLPTWRELLEQRFGIPTEFLRDENLKNDNLTLGEIASRLIGREQLQDILRNSYNRPGALPTTTHFCLASLELPVYITTNYDTLFEDAWEKINVSQLKVVCNADDAARYKDAGHRLFKIHGSSKRTDEMLILTRSEYRRHYRINDSVFEEIRDLIQKHPTVFTGFSHTDPEVGRLIDDIIFEYEHNRLGNATNLEIYNMQFEKDYVTTERFAAKGMVSLNVRLVTEPDVDPRTGGLAESIIELVDATDAKMNEKTSVENEINELSHCISIDLESAISELDRFDQELFEPMRDKRYQNAIPAILERFDLIKCLATQGLYLLDSTGYILGRRTEHLATAKRDEIISSKLMNSFGDRPYFQMSKSFRQPFVSSLFESKFNRNATFAICKPIVENGRFLGVLFSACQVGQWKKPVDAIEKIRKGNEQLGVYIMDSQGMVVAPPNGEFGLRLSPLMQEEAEEWRTGYDYTSLKILSKKDRIINRLSENIVPVKNDDDILPLDKDIEIYARIEKLGELGWRCAVSRTIRFES